MKNTCTSLLIRVFLEKFDWTKDFNEQLDYVDKELQYFELIRNQIIENFNWL